MNRLQLCKPRIALLASLSALAGAALGSPAPGIKILVPWLGVLVLACGAGALNQAREWRLDGRMERTRRRPVPSGTITPGLAFGFAGALTAAGLLVLAAAGPLAAGLGLAAVVWYDGVYRPLKRKTAFAAVPGALTGAFPPAIGWVGAGGNPGDPRLFMVCLLLFIWQVPHFWLLLLDRAPEYARAGLPALTDVFSEAQVRRLVTVWVLGTSACTLLVSLSRSAASPAARFALLAVSLGLGVQAFAFLVRPAVPGAGLFRALNIFLVAVLVILCLGRLPLPKQGTPTRPRPSVTLTTADASPR